MTTQESGRKNIDRDAHFLLPLFPIDELVASKTATALFGIAPPSDASECLIFGRIIRVFAALKLGNIHFGHTESFLHFGIVSLQIRRNARRNGHASNSLRRFRAMPCQYFDSSASCPTFRQQSTRTDSFWVTGFPSVVCDRGPDLRRFWTREPQRLEANTCSMSRRRQRLQRRHLQISYQLLRGDLVCERGVTACELDGVDGVLGRMVASTSWQGRSISCVLYGPGALHEILDFNQLGRPCCSNTTVTERKCFERRQKMFCKGSEPEVRRHVRWKKKWKYIKKEKSTSNHISEDVDICYSYWNRRVKPWKIGTRDSIRSMAPSEIYVYDLGVAYAWKCSKWRCCSWPTLLIGRMAWTRFRLGRWWFK